MNEHRSSTPRPGDRDRRWSVMTVVTLGPAGVILAVSVVALIDYLLTQTSPGLAPAPRALIATCIVGLFLTVIVVAAHLVRATRDHGASPAGRTDKSPEPVPGPRRLDDLDDELIRLIDRERLRGR